MGTTHRPVLARVGRTGGLSMSSDDRHAPERYPRDAAYLAEIHPAAGALFRDIEKVAADEGEPITERPSARLLGFVVRAIGARRALEIGTNLGYSAIWIANALTGDGELVAIDIDQQMLDRARANFERAGVSSKVTTHCGPALEVLPSVRGPFDFAYIDADKQEYGRYLDAVIERLRPGGVVAIDNLLWLGQAAHDPEDDEFMRATTPVIREFNRKFLRDPRLHATIVQVGDGVGLGVKLGAEMQMPADAW